MVKGAERIFKPVKVEFGQVHIAGGFTSKPEAVKSKSIEGADKRQHIFVKMSGTETWLQACVVGPNGHCRNSSFARSSLLDTLRARITRKADGIDDLGEDAAVAAVDDEYDPMDEIGSAPARGPTTIQLETDKQGRSRYYGNRAKNCIVTVNVACRCPEVDPTCTQMRAVKLFIVDRKTVWLSVDDVAWAIGYLHEQVHLKGVPAVADNDAGPGGVVAGSVPEGP
jgi:hypothetical protein